MRITKEKALQMLHYSLLSFSKMSDADWQALEAIVTPLTLSKGKFFAHQGDTPKKLGFIISGLVRVFYSTLSGEERTVVFRDEGRPVSAYFAYLEGKVVPFSIQALEDSYMLVAELSDIVALTSHYPYWAEISAAYTRILFTEKEQRERELLSMSALQRYIKFRERYPGIEARVKQHHVASYLGITPVSLSRIRATIIHRESS